MVSLSKYNKFKEIYETMNCNDIKDQLLIENQIVLDIYISNVLKS